MDNAPLKTLLKKIDTIKESWQIYEIFEEEKKKFKEEFEALEKDKKALMESFNELSVKHAILQKQNEELEIKNKILSFQTNLQDSKTSEIATSTDDTIEEHKSCMDFTPLQIQFNKIKNLLNSIKLPQNTEFKPLQKVEVIYQKNQKLLANPAKNYVLLEEIQPFLKEQSNLQDTLQEILLEYSKLALEIRDLKNDSLLNNV